MKLTHLHEAAGCHETFEKVLWPYPSSDETTLLINVLPRDIRHEKCGIDTLGHTRQAAGVKTFSMYSGLPGGEDATVALGIDTVEMRCPRGTKRILMAVTKLMTIV